ncbi:MAG: hypothetical protein U9R53_11600 [Chloroflexota bacterium]|nr:hypothetical protein [Chloroflexota bacterium]
MPKPELTFFSELHTEQLTKLFEDRFVIDDIKNLCATLSLGILDLSVERARVVKRLNKAGVPVIAWLLLPEEEGYWFNIDNYEKAAERYVAFKAWTTQHQLDWAGIGLDIEMNINDLHQLLDRKQSEEFIATLFQRFTNKKRVLKAQHAYQDLVSLIHADGYSVESYHIPLISEERRAHATVLQRIVGLVDLETDREVLMLYSSFLRPDGAAVLWSYAAEADSIGVGNTGGGVDLAGIGDLDPMTWEEFSRDLRLCVMLEKPIHIFCLEGCVEQGFLSKLNTFDWDEQEAIPNRINKIRAIRTGITVILWLLERPWVILVALASLIGLGFLFKQRKRS